MSLETSTVPCSLDAIQAERSRTSQSTSTLNFIVWIDVDDAQRREWILERAGMLGRKHPSFTLILDHTGARAGEATVSTNSIDPESTLTVQGERVDLDVSRASAEEIAGYVSALYAPGVPTVLWWSGMKESSRPIFDALLPLAETLVVDSSGGAADTSALCKLIAFHRARPDVVLRDLAWLRLLPWQDMIAQFFDDPDVLRELYTIRKLYVRSGSDAEAFYLGGWLASRLGWQTTGPDTFTDRDGNRVTFVHEREGELRRVRSICLDSETSWYHGELTDDEAVVKVWVEGEYAGEARLVPLHAIDNASLLERAVLEPGVDEVFETALVSAGTLLG